MTTRILVRHESEWAEFFVDEREPVLQDGRNRYSATWCCVSSFGVFGHHWSHMGEPFAAFIRSVGADYLLGKIARQVFDEERFKKWMRREIFTARTSRENKSEAAAEFKRLSMDYSGEALATLCYESLEISHCRPEWCDSESRSHDPQAVMFVEKMWPKFVEQFKAPPAPFAGPRGEE